MQAHISPNTLCSLRPRRSMLFFLSLEPRLKRADIRAHFLALARAGYEENQVAKAAFQKGRQDCCPPPRASPPAAAQLPHLDQAFSFAWTFGKHLDFLATLGQGAYGTVFKACLEGAMVAVKVPHKEGAKNGAEAMYDVSREYLFFDRG